MSLTLWSALAPPSPEPAVIVPALNAPTAPGTIISYAQYRALIESLRARLATVLDSLSPASPSPSPSPSSSSSSSPSTLSTQVSEASQNSPSTDDALKSTAIAIALPNCLAFAIAFGAATASARTFAAPLNAKYKAAEFEFYLQDLKAPVILAPQGAVKQGGELVRAARKLGIAIAECFWKDQGNGRGEIALEITDSGRHQRIELGPVRSRLSGGVHSFDEPRASDIALVLHTSGTTGRPKAVPLTHLNVATSAQNIVRTYQLSKTDRGLLVMPLFHVHGLVAGLLAPLSAGSTVILPTGGFSASQFWPWCTAHRATWYTAVPTMHQILLARPEHDDPSAEVKQRLRFIRSCSSPLAPTTLARMESRFGAPVLEAYAMTEAAHQMTSNPLPPAPHVRGSVGVPHGTVELAILDQQGQAVADGSVGEVCVRGPSITPGYLNNAEANASSFTADGWFRTGDQGRRRQEDGFLVLVGRIKELINRGGEKISPVEIDNAVTSNPKVAEAVAFAVPDDIYGQTVGVAIVPKQTGNPPSPEEIQEWVRERLAAFKVPQKIWFTDVMPKTATGKVQRRQVAEAMLRREQPRPKL